MYSQEFIIGAGLNFGFMSANKKQIFKVEFLSSNMLFNILLSNTGIFGQEMQLDDNEKALDRLLSRIGQGTPVALKLDPKYCYGLLKTTSPEIIPFLPAHNVVAYGYDLDKNKVFLYDSPSFNSMEMDIDDFCKGRNSGKTYPMNTYYELCFPSTPFPKAISMKLALLGVVERYKYTGKYLNYRTGCTALDRFAGNVRNWRNDLDDNEIVDKARILKTSITNGEATKGAFRNHFAQFLKEASDYLPYDFDELIHLYRNLGYIWNQVDIILDDIITDPDKGKYFKSGSPFLEYIDEAVDNEKNGIDLLENMLTTNDKS